MQNFDIRLPDFALDEDTLDRNLAFYEDCFHMPKDLSTFFGGSPRMHPGPSGDCTPSPGETSTSSGRWKSCPSC